jgi:hypothetical protein
MVLNLPLDECIDNTHILWIKRKRKTEKKQKENSNKRSKAEKGKERDHLKKTSLGPLRQAQRLDTSETKKTMLKQRAQTTKAHKSSPCTYASSPWTSANSGHKPVRPVPTTGQAGSTKTGQTGFQNRLGRFHTADHTPKNQKCKRNAQAPPWLLG